MLNQALEVAAGRRRARVRVRPERHVRALAMDSLVRGVLFQELSLIAMLRAGTLVARRMLLAEEAGRMLARAAVLPARLVHA